MIFITGDIHGNPERIIRFCNRMKLTENDTIILLGDVGANFYNNSSDIKLKNRLSMLPVKLLCIHGNHEMRPQTIPTYNKTVWNGGEVYVEDKYPNLLFAIDGEVYDLDGKKALAVGGAYSVDKFYRIERGIGWWADEQPSDEIKCKVEAVVRQKQIDIVLSHTCPKKYTPTEMFLPFIDQSSVDKSTEEWLDKIEEQVDYEAWYCGHWHVDKKKDKMHFLFNMIERFGDYDG